MAHVEPLGLNHVDRVDELRVGGVLKWGRDATHAQAGYLVLAGSVQYPGALRKRVQPGVTGIS